MPTQTVQELEQLAIAIFRAMGSGQTEAQIVGRNLVEANLAGHDSHDVRSGLTRPLGPLVRPRSCRENLQPIIASIQRLRTSVSR